MDSLMKKRFFVAAYSDPRFTFRGRHRRGDPVCVRSGWEPSANRPIHSGARGPHNLQHHAAGCSHGRHDRNPRAEMRSDYDAISDSIDGAGPDGVFRGSIHYL